MLRKPDKQLLNLFNLGGKSNINQSVHIVVCKCQYLYEDVIKNFLDNISKSQRDDDFITTNNLLQCLFRTSNFGHP